MESIMKKIKKGFIVSTYRKLLFRVSWDEGHEQVSTRQSNRTITCLPMGHGTIFKKEKLQVQSTWFFNMFSNFCSPVRLLSWQKFKKVWCEGTGQNENENDKVHIKYFSFEQYYSWGEIANAEWDSMWWMLTWALNLWEIALERPDSTASCGKR